MEKKWGGEVCITSLCGERTDGLAAFRKKRNDTLMCALINKFEPQPPCYGDPLEIAVLQSKIPEGI